MNARTLLAIAGIVATQFAGCGSPDPEISFDAKAGQPCRNCDTCSTMTSSCECRTCTMRAQDVEAKVLLACTSNGWSVRAKCPGGVSVSCTSTGGYRIQCLDENGANVPL